MIQLSELTKSFGDRTLFERLVGGLFARAVERYTAAFEARADAIYGPKVIAIASQQRA